VGDVIQRLATTVDQLTPERRVLVAVDGPDAAGKSTFARLLSEQLTRPVICGSIDDWHQPHEVRLRRGDESPEGYYEDSFDYDALIHELLQPFLAGASTVTASWFDYRTNQPRRTEAVGIASTAVLVFEGVFLLRPELRDYWDLRVHLDVPEAVTVARVVQRDAAALGGEEQVRRRYERRYLPGQALYREHAAPQERADVVLDNTDPERPRVLRWTRME
jgi:uridine kinase